MPYIAEGSSQNMQLVGAWAEHECETTVPSVSQTQSDFFFIFSWKLSEIFLYLQVF